jgi:hypothetical protein
MGRGAGVYGTAMKAWISLLPVVLWTGACAKPNDEAPVDKPSPAVAAPVAPVAPPPPPEPVVLADLGFATPESAQYDERNDVYLVSNNNGSPLDADGNGFISRGGADDTTKLELKWIDGEADGVELDAPKGLAVSGDRLYVADLSNLRVFDRDSGKPVTSIAIEGATFLNGLTPGPDGTVYASDSGLHKGKSGMEPSGTDAVYRVGPDDEVHKVAYGDDLGRPNGLATFGDDLWVVSYGSGELYRIGAAGKRVAVVKPDKGSLDGLLDTGHGAVLFSSWEANAIYRGPLAGPFSVVIAGMKAPADLGWDSRRQLLLIPHFNDNTVEIRPLPPVELQ